MLREVRALTFDCYGTLIDWETGLLGILNAWAQSVGVTERDDALLEAYGRHESAIEAESPALIYSHVVRETMRHIARELDAEAASDWVERLAGSIGEWPAFSDSAESLLRLKQRYQLGILSNVDHASFAGSARKLMVDFDWVVTAEDVGSYKPSLRNFRVMLDRLNAAGIEQHEVVHVAQSLFHDHAPAQQLGLRTVWIDRRLGKPGHGSTPAPPAGIRYDAAFPSMRTFASWATA